jgi:hypothetical protein
VTKDAYWLLDYTKNKLKKRWILVKT